MFISGKVSYFNNNCGYGYILSDKDDYYCHITQFVDLRKGEYPSIGQTVQFEIGKKAHGKKKYPRAVKITTLEL